MIDIVQILSPIQWTLIISGVWSVVLVVCYWPISESRLMRIALLSILVVPIVGQAMFWILMLWPSSQGSEFIDYSRSSTDVTDRWRHVFEERNPKKKLAKWKQMTRDTR